MQSLAETSRKPNSGGTLLPPRLCKRGAALLSLQCSLWGQDIRRAEGNLLLEYGMKRLRPPAAINGCSQYSAMLSDGSLLKLWGFGLYAGTDSGVYLNRYEFIPRSATLQDGWTPELFTGCRRTPVEVSLTNSLRWIAEYETWIVAAFGAAYRLRMVNASAASKYSPAHLACAWYSLAEEIEQWLVQRTVACTMQSAR